MSATDSELTSPPRVLTIAGSDPSGGAGIAADLKTFGALGGYGMAVITALTAQNTRGVDGVWAVPGAFIAQQLDSLLSDVEVDAVKIGMLPNAETARLLAQYLGDGPLGRATVVLDPVLVSTSRHRLGDETSASGLLDLLPLVDIVTPNLDEAAELSGLALAQDEPDRRHQAHRLHELGARRVLLKGGHSNGTESNDMYFDGAQEQTFHAPRVATSHTHGTGCTLSSALATLYPQLGSWPEAIQQAKQWLTRALETAEVLQVGHGHGPLHHFHESQRWACPKIDPA